MNITLIGMPGVGKSVIGKELARRLDYGFMDVDEIIEKKTESKLQQIIDKFGDDRLVEVEEKTVLELGKLDSCVISPGGSVIYSAEAMKFLQENSTIIFLHASFKCLKKRLANQEMRGIVGLKKRGLKILFNERLALYRKYAGIAIEMPEDFDVDAIVRKIIQEIFHKRK
jgi:shikimate kinase